MAPTPPLGRRPRPRPSAGQGPDGSGPTTAVDAPTTDYALAHPPLPDLEYDPEPDGDADPGEVVWAWVPFEEDASRGKDRPVLIVGRAHGRLIGLMLTSKDHDHDAADEARYGRYWIDVGTGGWDDRRRPSEVRLDRVLSLPLHGVRREGAALDHSVFREVVGALRELHGT